MEIECADVLEWAESYTGPKFHALLCDPPYELGFMGKDWDRSGIAFKVDTWAALAEHLLPGAFGMAFASARGWHRLAVAIEDAGLRIHPSIFGWSYGSGFPKATRLDTQIDRAAGAEREVVGSDTGHTNQQGDTYGRFVGQYDISSPTTPLAQSWQGHRYGLQAMKPALEPIIVFQKPYPKGKKTWEAITESGAGALWIDGGRVSYRSDADRLQAKEGGGYAGGWAFRSKIPQRPHNPQGRWPANFVLQHSELCKRVGVRRVKGQKPRPHDRDATNKVYGKWRTFDDTERNRHADADGLETVDAWDCVPECPVRRLGEQSGVRKSGARKGPNPNAIRALADAYDGGWKQTGGPCEASVGTAARFFFQSDWSYEIAERLDSADPVLYQAKASRKERDAGLGNAISRSDYRPNDPDENTIRTRLHGSIPQRNPHPTIKPIALCKWLATLLLPPNTYAPRRLLVPFAGTGSEMIGAGLVGWEYVLGIEMDAETVEIAQARIHHWLDGPRQTLLF